MKFLRILKHLLPTGRAWTLTIDKTLRKFFLGLSQNGDTVKQFIDEVWLDIFPTTTRTLGNWEDQFGLPDYGLDEEARRLRVDAAWKALGGQSPRYIEDVLQRNGFDVYVHEWWDPATEAPVGVVNCPTPRDPRTVLRPDFLGADVTGLGYPLVNIIFTTEADFIVLCGEAIAEAGEEEALCGNYFSISDTPTNYTVPDDPLKWSYFLYIGGIGFGDIAEIPESRRDEFEALCLKLCPAQLWLGMMVSYGNDDGTPVQEVVPGDFMIAGSNIVNSVPDYAGLLIGSSNIVNQGPEYTGLLAVASNIVNQTPDYSGMLLVSSNIENQSPEYTGIMLASGDNT